MSWLSHVIARIAGLLTSNSTNTLVPPTQTAGLVRQTRTRQSGNKCTAPTTNAPLKAKRKPLAAKQDSQAVSRKQGKSSAQVEHGQAGQQQAQLVPPSAPKKRKSKPKVAQADIQVKSQKPVRKSAPKTSGQQVRKTHARKA